MDKINSMSNEEFEKFHDDLIQRVLKYSNLLIEQGVESVGWTLTNNTKVTIVNSKKSFRKPMEIKN